MDVVSMKELARLKARAGVPNREKAEIFSEEDLEELRHSLAHLSPHSVREFYDRAHEDCRMVYNSLPSPKKMQTLIHVWKQLWKWR